jgi:hypothetical protein
LKKKACCRYKAASFSSFSPYEKLLMKELA